MGSTVPIHGTSPAVNQVVGDCGRDNLVRGSLRLVISYGDPVASLSCRGRRNAREDVGGPGIITRGCLRYVLIPYESLPRGIVPTARSLGGPFDA